MEITSLLSSCMHRGASDLHLSPGLPPVIRIHGVLHRLPHPPLAPSDLDDRLRALMNDRASIDFARFRCCDFRMQADSLTHCRVHVYGQRHGTAAAFRFLTAPIPTFEQLGLPAILQHIATRPHGLVLITGPAGSGKSTTLAAMIDYLNSTQACHILTLEDPVEFLHESKRGLITQCDLQQEGTDFAQALKRALREDPDVIMVGEMRDSATIALALDAAETGHLVLSTLHSRSAREAVSRLIGSFSPEGQGSVRVQLSHSLTAIIAQTLLRSAVADRRILAHEILIATDAVRHLIRDNRVDQLESVQQTGHAMGMHTLEQYLGCLVDAQRITRAEAGRHLGEKGWHVD